MRTIYISAMVDRYGGKTGLDAEPQALLDGLERAGFRLHWVKEWRSYDQIEREIAACDALLAIVDRVFTSSTWMASEVTWACGDAGAMDTGNPRMNPIPVFLFPVDRERSARGAFPFGYPGTTTLDWEVEKAVATIVQVLGPAD